jgi:thiosulfate/3-mercaptopyruvate sulfurtransferase
MNNSSKTTSMDIISTDELSFKRRRDWVLIDCRFDLADPDWGFLNFQEAHIPGAVYAHLDKDLSGQVTPISGRHPLPDTQVFADTLTRWGISSDTQVVVYDTSGGSNAARLWWMLRYFGHEQVAVLDGGYPQWLRENRVVHTGIQIPRDAAKPFVPHPNPAMVVTTNDVIQMTLDPAFRVIDARAPQRFRGEIEPIDPVAGHIPGAVNRFHADNLTSQGTLKSPAILRAEFLHLVQETSTENVIVYCGSGVTSCHHLLALELSGLNGARLYPGSWSEWIRDPSRPVAAGDE